ncbi:hypothetical protein E6C67_30960 [Azospirillum sp. TSA2s]|uniref:hypothetical protein n=1 Tax=Azospirillum sp. TSA2s TaxID=709810 RepID=UPI0010AA7688|nr:hypothetical protein [Azospirillum sp. TSA2s]QCG98113.1 hypothetical protein E6C67_30960 [Azospirillum sp. TSA2s]
MNNSPENYLPNDIIDADGGELEPYASAELVELDTGATRIVCNWGRSYDFTPWRDLNPVVPLIAASFARGLSSNEDEASANATNYSKFDRLKRFLRWWSGNPRPFGQRLLIDYKAYLLKEYAASTAWSNLQALFLTVNDLMGRGKIPRFSMPPNVNHKSALSEGKGGETLAHLLPSSYADVRDLPDLNHAILLELKQFCWENIRRAVTDFQQGQKWRAESENVDLDEVWNRREPSWTWDEALETTAKLIWKYCDGFYPSKEWSDETAARVKSVISRFHSYAAAKPPQRKKRFEYLDRWPSFEDVCRYIRPYKEFTCLFLPLFAEAGVGAEDVNDLRLENLQPSGPDGRFMKIVWEKGRSPGAELSTPSLALGGADAPTVPRAWEILVRETAELRSRAPSAIKEFLFIEGARREYEGTHVYRAIPRERFLTFRQKILDQVPEWKGKGKQPHFHLLRLIAPQLSLSLIRTTAMNVVNHRSGRDVVLAQKFADHSDPAQPQTTT